jgi:2-methylcitrate dehydratase PrpD
MTADASAVPTDEGADALTPTDVVAGFVAGFDPRELPAAARATARRGYLDCLGVALAGSAQPAGMIAARFAAGQGTGPATVWGHAFTAAPATAALVNGTAAHALDYDDVNWALLGHPSVSLVPATLAAGEAAGATGAQLIDAYACGFEVLAALGRSTMPGLSFDGGWHATGALGAIGATGAQLIDAYACGFEVLAALGRSTMPGLSFDGGWHATGALGAIGATAAVAHLLRLDPGQVRHALGIAVSEASGVVRNFGTMTKPLHAGLAAQAGIQAAGLAAAGFTADPASLEGKHGFYACFGARSAVQPAALRQLGQVWELDRTGVVIKPYPCGVAGHPAIDAGLALRQRLGPVRAGQVARITVGVTSYTLDKMRYVWPENELQAKFCIPYQLARALVTGPPTLADFTVAGVAASPEVRALAQLTELFLDEEIEHEWRRAGGSRPCRVRIEFTDGRSETELVRVSKGNPQLPLTDDELRAKFRDAASLAATPDRITELIETAERIDTVPHAGDLARLLRAPAA